MWLDHGIALFLVVGDGEPGSVSGADSRLSPNQSHALTAYSVYSVLLGTYVMLCAGNFLKPTRVLIGFTALGVLSFYANYNFDLMFRLTGWYSTRDPVAAGLAGGLIGAGIALYSYRLAMLMLHYIAAYNLDLMLQLASLTIVKSNLGWTSSAGWVCTCIAGLFAIGATLTVLSPKWEELCWPLCTVSGAVFGSFTSIGGAIFAFNRYLIWFPVGRLKSYSNGGAIWNVGDYCNQESCSGFLVSFIAFILVSIMVQVNVTAPRVDGYAFAIARKRFNSGHGRVRRSSVPGEELESGSLVSDLEGRRGSFDDLYKVTPRPDPLGAQLYMWSVLCITVTLVSSVSFTIDWANSNFFLALLFFLFNLYLIWGVTDFFVGSLSFHIVRLIWDFPPMKSAYYSQGLPNDKRAFICYCLLSQSIESSEETFENTVDCYLINLDPNFNMSAGIVSVTSKLSVITREAQLLAEWRQKIRELLQAELEAVVSAQTKNVPPEVPETRRLFWHVLSENAVREVGNTDSKAFRSKLEDVPLRVAKNLYWLHRSCKVLKKPGQYQDLAALINRGTTHPTNYTDEKYGKLKRKDGDPSFSLRANVTDDGVGDTSPTLDEMEAALQEDVQRLSNYGRDPLNRFEYTMVMDKDTKSETGGVLRLIEIAARNPEYGILQPALRVDDTGLEVTWYMFLESLRQVSSSNLPLAMFSLFQRYGFYGKGLINNSRMLVRVADVEALPIDILSHDTYEAKLLRPCYVKEVCLREEPASNQISALVQSTRWMLGEVRNACYPEGMWRSVINVMIFIYRGTFMQILWRRPYVRHEEIPASRGTEYLATMTFRVMHAGPVIMMVIVLRNILSPLGLLQFSNSFMAVYSTVFTIVALFVVPKGLLFLDVVPSLRLNWPQDPSQRPVSPQSRESSVNVPKFLGGKKIALSVLEAITSVFLFGPECLVGVIRMFRAYHAHISGNVTWKPQDQVDREIKERLGTRFVLEKTWTVLAAGLGLMLWDCYFHIFDVFSCLLWMSWCSHPFVCYFCCQPVSERGKQMFILRWVEQLKVAARERNTFQDKSQQVTSFMIR